jgi:diadenosine tetraphosphate (Ap4A) HIT family hydrolase
MAFELHPRLAADTVPVCELAASSLLLMNDARYPWCVVVPRVPDVRELHALPDGVRETVFAEVMRVAAGLEALTGATKMNVAALGNMVPQLHVHVIARNADDAAWPGPVWGVGQAEPYAAAALDDLLQRLRSRFGG